jgi:hypothetical protein
MKGSDGDVSFKKLKAYKRGVEKEDEVENFK